MRSQRFLFLSPLIIACAVQLRPVRAPLTEAPKSRADSPRVLSERVAQVDPEIASLAGVTAMNLCDSTGACTYVVEAGTDDTGKVPLVLVHGLGERGLRDFYPVLGELSRARRVLAIDLPGLGRSTLGNQAPTPQLFAARIRDVLAKRVQGPFDLLGHSLGGAAALLTALEYQARVQHLVLVDVAGVLHREAFVGSQISGGLSRVHRISPRAAQLMIGAGKAVASALRNFEPSDSTMRFGVQELAGPQVQAASALIEMDVGPILDGVATETLLLWGASDTIAPLRTAQVLEQRIHGSQLIVLEGVGHVPMAERPREMTSAVLAFLDAASRPPKHPQPTTALSADYVCDGKNDVVVRGHYKRIFLRDCHRVLIERVNADSLEAKDSDGEILQSAFARGVRAEECDLVFTGGNVDGAVALRLDESRVDIAGTRIRGTQAAVMAIDDSRALFSLTSVESPYVRGSLHGSVGLREGEGF